MKIKMILSLLTGALFSASVFFLSFKIIPLTETDLYHQSVNFLKPVSAITVKCFEFSLFSIARENTAGYTLLKHVEQILPIIEIGILSAFIAGINIKQLYIERY